MGYAPKFFGVDGMDGILTMEGFDPKLAEGVMLLTPFNADATDEKTASFVKKYKEQFGETPNQFAADATTVFTLTSRHSRMQALRRICPLRTCATR